MPTNEPFRAISSLCELDSTRLSNIALLRLRRQMDQGLGKKLSSKYIANVDLKYRLRSVNNEGDNSSSCDIEHTEFRIGSRCARKLAGPLNTPPPHPTSCFHTLRGRHLRYLIGQQRSQSSPPSVSKSSGNRTAIVGLLSTAEGVDQITTP